jgi:membrane-bound lytic murein transglycosylase MltF
MSAKTRLTSRFCHDWPTGFAAAFLCVLCVAASTGRADEPPTVAHDLGAHVADRYTADLDEIIERRYLRVLTSNNSFDYFIHEGRHAGYQYEMVRAFTKHLNQKYSKGRHQLKIQFEILPIESDQLVSQLLAGRGDLIASRMTVTPERRHQVLFSDPYRTVDELVVAGPGIEDELMHDLSGRRVAVRRSSSYFQSLKDESARLVAAGKRPIRIEEIDEAFETENILGLVAAGRFGMTVADSIVAETAVAIYPELRILPGIKLREGGKLAWATHLTARELAAEMSAFLRRYRHGSLLGNIALNKYFTDELGVRARIRGEASGRLSPYDDDFRRAAEEFGFDWRLIAAVAYQESRFKQNSRNRSGAVGLFQIKPKTAREPYIDIPEIAGEANAANNIRAGTKYLAWIKARYFDSAPEMRERDRMRMTLAAYNAGPRTLINARRRAEKMGLDSNKWFRNVELALLDMRKQEPVKYVSEINQRYLAYTLLGVE